ncbi:hypothetical protein HDU93_008630, partial [Gonapodya sp. JEL0774]
MVLYDSWKIVLYLEDNYPELPSLIVGDNNGRALAFFFRQWVLSHFSFLGLSIAAKDIHDRLHEKDKEYIRKRWELLLGKTLEESIVGRDLFIETFRVSLAPVRNTLAAGARFLCGDKPGYPDFALMGHFMWLRSTSPSYEKLLENDDLVALWRDRVRESFSGIVRREFRLSPSPYGQMKPAEEEEDVTEDDGNVGTETEGSTKEILKERDFYVKVLSSAPSPREARSFLQKFSKSLPPPKTHMRTGPRHRTETSSKPFPSHPLIDTPDRIDNLAIVLVETGLPRADLESFATTLVYLQKLGLTTIVVLGEPGTSALHFRSQSIASSVNTKEVRDRALHEAVRVANVLDRSGGRGMPVYDGVFYFADGSNTASSKLGPNDRQLGVSLTTIHAALRMHQTPVITPLASSPHVPLSSSSALQALAQALVADTRLADPARLIIVNSRGGVRTQEGPLSLVSLEEDYDGIVEEFAKRSRAVTASLAPLPFQQPSRMSAEEDQDELWDPSQLRDLELCKVVLDELPTTSSAIIAAASASPTLL